MIKNSQEKLIFFALLKYRHDVTNATRDLVKDSTQDLKILSSSYQSLDSKKTVNVLIV